MKYHTLSTSSLQTEGKKSTLTIYAGPNFLRDKMGSTETSIVRCELEMAQRALKLQTRRCRQLVSEFTRKLQAKELEVISERKLRDEQLTKVLRSLLVFEARLKQEQIFIRHQLEEKDDVIQRQKKELWGLRSTIQYCKTCSQFYTPSNVDSCDSSSEYTIGNHENWDSGSDIYGSISEECGRLEHSSSEDTQKQEEDEGKVVYEKNKFNKFKEGSNKRCKKVNGFRRMTGTYFEVLKSKESSTECSLDSSDLSDCQKTKAEIEKVSDRIEDLFNESEKYSEKMNNLHGIKSNSSSDKDQNLSSIENVEIEKVNESKKCPDHVKIDNHVEESPKGDEMSKTRLISDTIQVFDPDNNGQNDNWYASASDPEDDEQRDIYRNNPVLECMNQILLQNINDSVISPPKSPELERNYKSKTQKRVKFSDEDKNISINATEVQTTIQNLDENTNKKENNIELSLQADYYETPIQTGANFYEVPQSIYSNDYEQILSKCGDSIHNWPIKSPTTSSKIENLQENKINRMATQKLTIAKNNNMNELEKKSHYYIDMDVSPASPIKETPEKKKNKVSKTPPALPPKPANLVSKFKIQAALLNKSCDNLENLTVESEPDYCSISELNLPTEKMIMSKSNVQFINEVNSSTIKSNLLAYDPISLPVLNNENNNFQISPKKSKSDRIVANVATVAQINMLKNKNEPEIPKLPQVSEIIIPEETEEQKKIDHISQDNYIKNNSQLLKQKDIHSKDKHRNKIMVGTSVSTLVSNFNNQHFLSQVGNRNNNTDRSKLNEKLFSNFESSQDCGKQQTLIDKSKDETLSFEKFDLSQNFEEFNLDECEIGEEYQLEVLTPLNCSLNDNHSSPPDIIKETTQKIQEMENHNLPNTKFNTSVEIVRATKDVRPQSIHSIQQLQKSLSTQRNNYVIRENNVTKTPVVPRNPEPSYEHFLECTGLSSKSILTPSRILTNHKSMLKPKDIKLRSRVKSAAVFENSNGTIKYWSEPYL